MGRSVTKATHCKQCNGKFGDVERAGSNRLCKECYKDYQRYNRGYAGREEWRNWNIEKRAGEYEIRRKQMQSLNEREEWLALIRVNLEKALTQIP